MPVNQSLATLLSLRQLVTEIRASGRAVPPLEQLIEMAISFEGAPDSGVAQEAPGTLALLNALGVANSCIYFPFLGQ